MGLLIVGDLLMAPATGIGWIFRQIHKAYEAELANENAAIRAELTSIYSQLERGQISEEQFEQKEKLLLDRLDELEAARAPAEESEEPGEDEPQVQVGAVEPARPVEEHEAQHQHQESPHEERQVPEEQPAEEVLAR